MKLTTFCTPFLQSRDKKGCAGHRYRREVQDSNQRLHRHHRSNCRFEWNGWRGPSAEPENTVTFPRSRNYRKPNYLFWSKKN